MVYLIILLMIFTLIVIFSVYEDGKYSLPVFFALIIRLALIYFERNYPIFGHGDLVDYLPFFEYYKQSSWTYYISRTHVFFYTALYPGWLYEHLGDTHGIFAIKAMSAFFSILVIFPLNSIIKSIYGVRIDSFYTYIIFLWPTWLRYSIEVGRTSITAFFLLGTIAIILDLLNGFHLKNILTLFVFIFFTLYLRIHYVAVLLPVFIIVLMRMMSNLPKIISVIILVAFGSCLILVSYQFYFAKLGSYIELDSVEGLANFASKREEGGSAYLGGLYPSSVFDLLWYLPIHAFYFMFSPMIFDVRSAFQLGSSLQALFTMFIIFRIVKNKLLLSLSKTILAVILCGAVGFGAVTKNAGGAERWRLPFTLIILSLGVTLKRRNLEYISVK
ncbi:hypothetical protein, partial [Vibrio fluvialis]|uniref:hypothetical protein n=1 Tax=Vibrio fluvialis TaxID=676 RepID=UPI0014043674